MKNILILFTVAVCVSLTGLAQQQKVTATTATESTVTPAVKSYCDVVDKLSDLFLNITPDDKVMQSRANAVAEDMKKLTDSMDKTTVLTQADKSLLKKKLEKLYRAMIIGSLKAKGTDYDTLDAATKDQVEKGLQSVIKSINENIDSSKTLGDALNGMKML